MALINIYALQTQYQNSEDEYNHLMQNMKRFDPSSDEGVRAKQLNKEMRMILRKLIELLNVYKQPTSSDHYSELLAKYELLEKNNHVKVDYSKKIKDNKILMKMNEYYFLLWACLLIVFILLV